MNRRYDRMRPKTVTGRMMVYDYREEDNTAVPSYLHERILNMSGPVWPR